MNNSATLRIFRNVLYISHSNFSEINNIIENSIKLLSTCSLMYEWNGFASQNVTYKIWNAAYSNIL